MQHWYLSIEAFISPSEFISDDAKRVHFRTIYYTHRTREEEKGGGRAEAAPRGRVRDARRRAAREAALRVARASRRGARGEGELRKEGPLRLRIRSGQICGTRRFRCGTVQCNVLLYFARTNLRAGTMHSLSLFNYLFGGSLHQLNIICTNMNAIGGSGGSKQASSEREASTLDLLKQFESQLQSANQSGKLITVQ